MLQRIIWKFNLNYPSLQSKSINFDKFSSRVLHEKHVAATWNLGNHLSISLKTEENENYTAIFRLSSYRQVNTIYTLYITKQNVYIHNVTGYKVLLPFLLIKQIKLIRQFGGFLRLGSVQYPVTLTRRTAISQEKNRDWSLKKWKTGSSIACVVTSTVMCRLHGTHGYC